MKRLVTANITRTAVCVMLLSILPAFAIIVATGIERYANGISEDLARSDRFVRSIANRQNQVADVMETLVKLLARVHNMREGDTDGASILFRHLVANSPDYDNILLLDNNGLPIASALPLPPEQNFSADAFFKRALSRDAFSVGDVMRSPSDNKPILYFSIPVTVPGKSNPCVLGIAFALSRYEEMLSEFAQPAGAAVYCLDGTGALAFAYSQSGGTPDGGILGDEIWRNVRNADGNAGHFLVGGDAGKAPLQVTFRKLFLSGMDLPYLSILYAQPATSANTRAATRQYKDIIIFTATAFFSMAAALGLCWHTVTRPWRRLLAAAEGVASGALSTRVEEKGVGGEIGALGREFNAMTHTLHLRDAELSAARDHAEHSRNAKSEFLANMSHEIRTSMNAILGMAYLVLKTNLTAQQKGYVSKLLGAANTLLKVINDILDFSKIEAGKLSMERIGISLRRIVSTVRSESAARLGDKKLGFAISIDNAVPDNLLGDPLRLSQALMILVDDAVSRSERGEISFACSVKEQTREEVTLEFSIRDASVGFTPAQIAEIREIFTLDGNENGHSLDTMRLRLTICNKLFRMMGGGIEVAGVFGEGVLFTASARFGLVDAEYTQPDRLFEGWKALVVDGNAVSRQDLVEILPRFGFLAECVPDFDAARDVLRKAETERAPFSVAFVDWRPSASQTLSLVTGLKAASGGSSPLPVILTTAAGRAALPVSLEELHIDALLPKPINESLVLDTLMNVLQVDKDALKGEAAKLGSEEFGGIRVLLAEDNAVNQQIAVEIMKYEGIIPAVAADGEEAVTLLHAAPDAFDIVLMDIQMPKMDGFTATRALRSQHAFHPLRLPIIAMTAHSDTNELAACLAAGMNDCTGKPIVVDDFFNTLRRWMPVRTDGAEKITGAVALIRGLLGEEDQESQTRLNETLEALLPVLHEGRVAMLRAAFGEGGPGAVEEMLETLSAMARDLLPAAGRNEEG